MATALFLRDNHCQFPLATRKDHSRMHVVRLAKLESKIRKPLLELFGQPRTCGKAANEKCELLMVNKKQRSNVSGYTDRVGGKASSEVISDGVCS